MEGRCKQLRITRRVDGWYVLLVCEMPKPEPLAPTGQTIGVDVGISSFATLSNGEEIDNPRHLESALENLKKQQRQLAKKEGIEATWEAENQSGQSTFESVALSEGFSS